MAAVIDIHTHAFPDKLAARAISTLEEVAPWRAVGKGTVRSLLKSMDAAGIDISVPCAIATRRDQEQGILQWCCKIRSGRIEPFASVHPDTPDAGAWVRRIAEAGLAGVKLHPMYQECPADDPRMSVIFDAAADAGLIVAVHSGADIAFELGDDRASPQRLRAVIDRRSDLKLLCTHLGGWRVWDDAADRLTRSGVFVETSFSLKFLSPQRTVELIRRYGTDRVMFGTDWPWRRQKEEVDAVRALPLSEKEIDAILRTNAAELLGF